MIDARFYSRHKRGMTYRRRKRLRERMEARKLGQSEYVESDDEAPAWMAWLRWLALSFQALALILVLVEIYFLIGNDFVRVDYTKVAIYVVMFFTGRMIQFGLALFTR